MPANSENSAVATGLEKVSFIPIPMKGNVKECSHYHTIALISHASNFAFPPKNSVLTSQFPVSTITSTLILLRSK